MTTYPLATLGPTIDSTGISAPGFVDILASLTASFQLIYGADAYLGPDSQDGQWLAVLAKGYADTNAACIAAYNSRSPSTAQGVGLSAAVKINGLRREVPSNSTVDVALVGVAGTVITNGAVGDGTNTWRLPASVTIPLAGTITVTATCSVAGAVFAAAGTVNQILTPTRGWQSVTNAASATQGAPVETDSALRRRQGQSTALAALTPLQAVVAAVANLPGVQSVQPYENDTGAPDANGIPAHSISLVVDGGDTTQIAQAIQAKKNPGTGTYGTTSSIVLDSKGVPVTINFYRPTIVRLSVAVNLKALGGYVSTTGDSILAALAAYVVALNSGDDVYLNKLVGVAENTGANTTFNITSIFAARYPATPGSSDIVTAFNENPSLVVADIVLTVT